LQELPGEMKKLVVKGRVVSGVGEGKYFTQLDWVRQQFQIHFGFDPVPGTFNVRIAEHDRHLLGKLEKNRGTPIVPPDPSFCAARCFPVQVAAISGVLVIPSVDGYSHDVLEIMAPVHVRERTGLQDDDPVEVEVFLDGG
jgi:riboflavin kinase